MGDCGKIDLLERAQERSERMLREEMARSAKRVRVPQKRSGKN